MESRTRRGGFDMTLAERARAVAGGVIDPCSAASGCPLTLAEMGLLGTVEVVEDHVRVSLRLTSPGCHFAPLFAQEVENRLLELPGIRSVAIAVEADLTWSEASILPEGRERLARSRALKLLRMSPP